MVSDLEAQFIEIENKWLNAEYFDSIQLIDSLRSIDANPDMFLIDQDFRVVYPETAEDKDLYSLSYNRNWNSDYRKYMARAEAEDSGCERILKFNQFLDDFVIQAIKERSGFSEFNKSVETKRTYMQIDDTQYLVSFKEMLIRETDKRYFEGIRWNLVTVKLFGLQRRIRHKSLGLSF